MNNKVSVEIYGRSYTIKSAEHQSYIVKLAEYVDEQMRSVSKIDNRFDGMMVSTLTSINIADKYFKALEDTNNMRKQLATYIDELNQTKNEVKRLKLEMAAYASGNDKP